MGDLDLVDGSVAAVADDDQGAGGHAVLAEDDVYEGIEDRLAFLTVEHVGA